MNLQPVVFHIHILYLFHTCLSFSSKKIVPFHHW